MVSPRVNVGSVLDRPPCRLVLAIGQRVVKGRAGWEVVIKTTSRRVESCVEGGWCSYRATPLAWVTLTPREPPCPPPPPPPTHTPESTLTSHPCLYSPTPPAESLAPGYCRCQTVGRSKCLHARVHMLPSGWTSRLQLVASACPQRPPSYVSSRNQSTVLVVGLWRGLSEHGGMTDRLWPRPFRC